MQCVPVAFTVALLATGAWSYPYFQGAIPNGAAVPHPCPQFDGGFWYGVGHENPEGAGDRNPFGMDFARNQFMWDDCLCNADSDGDGKTNGEELGDPDCKWMAGDPAPMMPAQSHPGVCEPMASSECRERNAWLNCDRFVPFQCPAFERNDTRFVDLSIARTAVPAQETYYICKAMTFPDEVVNGDFHMIGAETLIDNIDILHHLIVYGCPDNAAERVLAEYGTERECGEMVTETCDQILYIWAVGVDPDCFAEEFGVRIGQSGFKTVAFEYHWNNPRELADQFDGSGVRFYYTPNLRDNDAQTLFFGKLYLELPPGQPVVNEEATCPGRCTTNMFQETVYISNIIPHMHLLGRGMLVEHIRNSMVIGTLVDEKNYDFNQPRRFKYNPPIEFQPGDEMRVVCTFDTTSSDKFVFFGDGTSDEMCIAITQYYPIQPNADHCWGLDMLTGYCPGPYNPGSNSTEGNDGDIFDSASNEEDDDDDDDDDGGILYGDEYLGACYANFASEESGEAFGEEYYGYMAALMEKCDWNGFECFEGCKEVIDTIMMDECFVAPGNMKENIMPFMIDFVHTPLGFPYENAIFALASCNEYGSGTGGGHGHDGHDHGVLCPTDAPPLPPSAAPAAFTSGLAIIIMTFGLIAAWQF